ncbi:MAG: response regulator [Myxococcaceae bacterium]
MPKILTVDDSRAVRTIVSKHVKEIGIDVIEAEDGQQGLAKLAEEPVDLVLLDVTMPVMDGPAMLHALRDKGDKTPVILLTSESKTAILVDAMKAGIDDYILKPFKQEELLAKIRKSLKMGGAISTPVAIAAPPPPPMAAPSPLGIVQADGGVAAGGKKFIDVMVVDDMENVAKRLKSLMPTHVSSVGFTNAQSAVSSARDSVYRVILVDTDIPEVDSITLAQQLKTLQPHAMVVALVLKSAAPNPGAEYKEKGFNDVLVKPFSPENIEDFVLKFFDRQELVAREDNLLRVSPCAGKADRLERYYTRLGALIAPAMDAIAAACFEDAVLDLTQLTMTPELAARLLLEMSKKASTVGLALRLIGSPDLTKLLHNFEETKNLKVFANVAEAKAA